MSHTENEQVSVKRGAFIPSVTPSKKPKTKLPKVPPALENQPAKVVLGGVMIAFLTAFLSAALLPTRFGTVLQQTAASSIPDELRNSQSDLDTLANSYTTTPDFFSTTKTSFISDEETFIEANLRDMKLRYYEDGEVVASYPILSKGRPGSWWETPTGLYEVRDKIENHYSTFGNVYLPWSLPFQGNFFIHGWPEYQNGDPVPEGYSGGCIRLSNEDASNLYSRVEAGVPILVHESEESTSRFQYELRIPEMGDIHYLIADVEDATVLASSDFSSVVPIASLTKLMTALIAAEHINLDSRVSIGDTDLVQSLIPRLEERQSVSMYSLLQLLLLESSNEAAEVIASQLGRAQFINLMNEKAYAIGMENTTFADASGLDDRNVSTLGDLLRLVQYIHNNRRFIFNLTMDPDMESAYQGGEFAGLENFNKVADSDDFYGGKVGETSAAGQTSITLHKVAVRGVERIVTIIVLNSEDREQDVNKLHTYFTERFVVEQ